MIHCITHSILHRILLQGYIHHIFLQVLPPVIMRIHVFKAHKYNMSVSHLPFNMSKLICSVLEKNRFLVVYYFELCVQSLEDQI